MSKVKKEDIEPEFIERGDDPPDFIVTIDGKRVAIEETEFHSNATGANGRPRRAVEEEWRKLQQLIERERKQFPDLDRVNGLLFFKCLQVPSMREWPAFVKELLVFACSTYQCKRELASGCKWMPIIAKYGIAQCKKTTFL